MICFDIHGSGLEISTDWPRLVADARSLLRGFECSEGTSEPFRLNMCYGRPDRFQPDQSKLTQFWSGRLAGGLEMTYYSGPALRMVDLPGRARMHLDLEARRGQTVVAPGSEWALADGCIIPMLCDILAAAGQYILHAACLAAGTEDGAPAVLIAGASGTGKTTTSLALSRGKLRMLADDTCFVIDPGERPNAQGWALPASCKVLEKTLSLLPWLMDIPRKPGREPGEYTVEVNDPDLARQMVRPRVIIFLDPPNDLQHKISPMDKLSAVKAITRENVRAFEPSASGPNGRAFQVFAALVSQCETYSLSAGPALDGLPEQIEQLALD